MLCAGIVRAQCQYGYLVSLRAKCRLVFLIRCCSFFTGKGVPAGEGEKHPPGQGEGEKRYEVNRSCGGKGGV